VRTGKLAWTFHSVPEKGEIRRGHLARGGARRWRRRSQLERADHRRGAGHRVHPVRTARFDFYGGNRIGDNLFGNSLVALDARTGSRLWHFQAVHHDLWDYDFPQAPKIPHRPARRPERRTSSRRRPSREFLYVLDRVTGKPLWPIEEKPVAADRRSPGEKTSPTPADTDAAAAVCTAIVHRKGHQPVPRAGGTGVASATC